MNDLSKETLVNVSNLCSLAYKEDHEMIKLYDDYSNEIHIDNNCACVFPKLKCCPKYYEGDNNDCEFYICFDKSDNLMVIFRGTESYRDILSDLNASRSKFTIPNLNHSDYPYVHSGFLRQFNSIMNKLNSIINTYITNKGYFNKKHITFSGHSLGGALATLAALYYHYKYKYYNIYVNCVSFGSPRVGGSLFCRLFNNSIHKSYRFVNKNDIVTMIPTRWRFKHVDGLKWFNDKEVKDHMENRFWDSFTSTFINWFGNTVSDSSSFIDDHSCNLYIEKLQKYYPE